MQIRNRFGMCLLMHYAGPIYYLIWTSKLQRSRREEEGALPSGWTVFFMIVTLGLYHFIWQWRTCAWLYRKTGRGCRVITLILSLLIIGWIINPLIIQGQINRYIKRGY